MKGGCQIEQLEVLCKFAVLWPHLSSSSLLSLWEHTRHVSQRYKKPMWICARCSMGALRSCAFWAPSPILHPAHHTFPSSLQKRTVWQLCNFAFHIIKEGLRWKSQDAQCITMLARPTALFPRIRACRPAKISLVKSWRCTRNWHCDRNTLFSMLSSCLLVWA